MPTLELAKVISKEAMRENGIDGDGWLEEVRRLCEEDVPRQGTGLEIQYFVVGNG